MSNLPEHSTNPAPCHAPVAGSAHALGVDLGGTKIEAVLLRPGPWTAATLEQAVLLRKRVPTPRPHGYEAIVAAVCGLVRELLALVPEHAPCTVGLGIPGSVDSRSGLVRNANTTVLIGRPLQQDVVTALGRPVSVENDADCFTLAEARCGAGQGHGLVFGVIMGTGCGGGISIGGRIRRGPHNIAGEWGHMVLSPHGAPCYCGKRGCVETMLSGSGVERDVLRRHGRRLSMPEIRALAQDGDPQCRQAMERFLDDFGRCLGAVVSLLDPDCIVLGGGLSSIPELYTTGQDRLRHYAFHDQLETPLLQNRLGDSAGVFGAALIGAGGET